ncbi:MAG: flagella basal body P-ring formation protein FlgA [Halieaceae bacterium]|jgi:flagella basal body P-ring formation protein FlgA
MTALMITKRVARRGSKHPRSHPQQRATVASGLRSACLGLLASLGAGNALGATTHPHGEILAEVEIAALSAAQERGYEDVAVYVRPLDRRLRPGQCGEALAIVRPHAGRVLGPVSYGVRCSGSKPWTLYLRAEVSAGMELPVLRQPLQRGSLIGAGDLEMAKRRITSDSTGIITRIDHAVGMELSRALAAGSLLRFGQVAPPQLVARGQMVTLVAGSGGLEVNMQGKAMANAAAGDRLWVTNDRSGRRVEGRVMSDGRVRIQ